MVPVANTRVLVVDDHPAVRAGVRALIDAEPDMEAVGEASNEFDLEPALRTTRPDVVILDYQLQTANGISLGRQIKRGPLAPKVLIYSAFTTEHMTAPAMVAGVDACVDKGIAPRELAVMVRRLAAGESLLPSITPDALASALERLAPGDRPLLRSLAQGTALADLVAASEIDGEALEDQVDRVLNVLVVDMGAPRSG